MLFSTASRLTSRRPEALVIGSGAVGLVAAARLSERGRSVLVLEAGGDQLDRFENSSVVVSGRPHKGIYTARSRALGGTTNLWGGQLVELQAADFLPKPSPGAPTGWPLSFSELTIYYPLAYRLLGQDYITDSQVLAGIKADSPNTPPELNYFLTRWMRRPNFARTFDSRISASGTGSIDVLLNSQVVRLHTDSTSVTAVDVIHDGDPIRFEAPLIFLAAGTVENVRLLLSDCPAGSHPWSSNPLIGAYFQDHLGGQVGTMHGVSSRVLGKLFSTILYGGDKFQPKVRSVGPDPETGLSCQAMIAFDSGLDHLVYLKQLAKGIRYRRPIEGGLRLTRLARAIRYAAPLAWGYLHDHRIAVPRSCQPGVVVQSEQVPRRDSRLVAVAGSSWRHGLPVLSLDWKWGAREWQNVRDFARRLEVWMGDQYGVRLELRDELAHLGAGQANRVLHDTNHQAGGLIMGHSSDNSVVDSRQVVHGTTNLIVLGACTFPSSGDANTTLTAIALAMRSVDRALATS